MKSVDNHARFSCRHIGLELSLEAGVQLEYAFIIKIGRFQSKAASDRLVVAVLAHALNIYYYNSKRLNHHALKERDLNEIHMVSLKA